MPKISVLIPSYNSADFIEECIKSVVNQSLENIEILC
ncbi:glycosyltransferase family 2 protein, partial [Helicobacter pullorum]